MVKLMLRHYRNIDRVDYNTFIVKDDIYNKIPYMFFLYRLIEFNKFS